MPFGDVINWDMVPEFALQSLTVLAGANPSSGLNTLGGAIVLETVDGRSVEGLHAEVGFGSHSRKRADVGLGQRHAYGWHSDVDGTVFDENGGRDQPPTGHHQAHGILRMGERNLNITPGTRMAGLRRQTAKIGADWTLARALSVGADMQIVSSRGVQGTEDGLLEDGASEIHRLRVPGHSLLHLRAQWRATPALSQPQHARQAQGHGGSIVRPGLRLAVGACSRATPRTRDSLND